LVIGASIRRGVCPTGSPILHYKRVSEKRLSGIELTSDVVSGL
jgi:hypothetical protein